MNQSLDMRVGLWLYAMVQSLKQGAHDFFTDERGDTNFISLFMVLAVVVVLGVLFKDNVTGLVNDLWSKIQDAAGNFGN